MGKYKRRLVKIKDRRTGFDEHVWYEVQEYGPTWKLKNLFSSKYDDEWSTVEDFDTEKEAQHYIKTGTRKEEYGKTETIIEEW